MNALEAEYSFLAPTWKLPSVATPSIFPHTIGSSYLSNDPNLGPDWTLWQNTMYNSRYIPAYAPSTTTRRNFPVSTNFQRPGVVVVPQNYQTNLDRSVQPGLTYDQLSNNQYAHNGSNEDGLNLTISLHPSNDHDNFNNNTSYIPPKNHMVNRGLTYAANGQNNHQPVNQKRRVQIVDHNRQSPATTINENMSERNSRNSNPAAHYAHFNRTPDSYKAPPKSKTPLSHQGRDHSDDNRHAQDGNNVSVHDYLYGLAAPDPGSYANAFKQHQRRLQEEKQGRKTIVNEYRAFARNYGFGPAFGNANQVPNEDKLDTEKRRKHYARIVQETNQHKLEEQRRIQMMSGQQKVHQAPVPKYQRFYLGIPKSPTRRKAREYAEKIEKPHNIKPVVRLRDPTSGNVIIRDASHQNRHRLTS